ncbi:hypothetical protein PV08_08925 [Exophiala spinifera]|uniref:Uncharacterized protein n=1 Tax=Exophiala spinifera TaxID=91928 RepID=A0A0D2BR66_9EURO|nr:uncharacterized protein PV08_08925 [Exophiala spinifera]KIW13734.1 hypothetical protein PV08_08925 [Exophiala spinifera]
MEAHVQRLVDKTWEKFSDCDLSQRLLIAVAGIPGSGKTTLAASVARGLNKAYRQSRHAQFPNSPESDTSWPDIAIVVPLDGFHLTRRQLSAMPNAEEAIFRRGAAFTFDADGYLDLVARVRRPITPETPTVYAPSFDHAVKDPVADDVAIPPTARIVLFEGLYTALDADAWRDAHRLMDDVWFVDADIETATQRVAARNFAAGITDTFEKSLERTEASDMRNAREILEKRLPANEVVPSVEDEAWARSKELVRVDGQLQGVDVVVDDDDDQLRGQVQNNNNNNSGHGDGNHEADADDDESVSEEFRQQRMMRMDSIAALAADGVGM